jgi:hypothetical protein
VKAANQIALVHMFFNLTGICIFYPVPWMRLPVRIARVLGSTTATYRWFAVVYLAFMFFIFPSTMFLLSLAGPVPLYCFLGNPPNEGPIKRIMLYFFYEPIKAQSLIIKSNALE